GSTTTTVETTTTTSVTTTTTGGGGTTTTTETTTTTTPASTTTSGTTTTTTPVTTTTTGGGGTTPRTETTTTTPAAATTTRGAPLPWIVQDPGMSFSRTTCSGTTDTLSGLSPADAGGNRGAGGSNHHNTCTTSADCPGGSCRFLQCTTAGCLFGPPLPVPNASHSGAATSSCVINVLAGDAAGTSDCNAGSTSG